MNNVANANIQKGFINCKKNNFIKKDLQIHTLKMVILALSKLVKGCFIILKLSKLFFFFIIILKLISHFLSYVFEDFLVN